MRLEAGKRLDGWTLVRLLGKGGNGTVWQVTGADGNQAAIKIFHDTRPQRYQRFQDEVETLRMLRDRPGIMPILDAYLPERPRPDAPAWLVMPVAKPLADHLHSSKLEEVVSAIQAVADTLASLAAEGISHRDIKPDNLFWYEGRATIGDFGLAEFPDKAQITQPGEKLGPIYFIAPEMLNDAINADGRLADVYSLAKTFWVLATGQKYPVPGEQRVGVPGLNLSSYAVHPHALPLDVLIEQATRFHPAGRCTMEQLATELRAWLDYRQEDIVTNDLSELITRIVMASVPAQQEEERRHGWIEIATQISEALQERLQTVRETIEYINSPRNYPFPYPDLYKFKFNARRAIGDPDVVWDTSIVYEARSAGLKNANLCLPIIFELLADGRLHMTAMYWVGQGFSNDKVMWNPLWHSTWAAPVGTTELQTDLDALVSGVTVNLHGAVERFAEMVEALQGS